MSDQENDIQWRPRLTLLHGCGTDDVVPVTEREVAGWLETIHLLSSPRNAERLLRSVREAEAPRRA